MDAKRTLEKINKPTKGDELIKALKEQEEKQIKEEPKKEQDYKGTIVDGVEVVDVKAVPSREKKEVDKFGIPKRRNDWDKI